MHLLLPPTLCSSTAHRPPPPHRHLQFRTIHRKNLPYLASLSIIQSDPHSLSPTLCSSSSSPSDRPPQPHRHLQFRTTRRKNHRYSIFQSDSSSHRPPQPYHHLQFRTTHRKSLSNLTSLGIIQSDSSSHRPPPPHRHLQFRTTHRQNLRYLTSLGIIHQSDTPSPTTLSPTLCSSSSSHRPPPPHRRLQFRTTHRKNLPYLTSLSIIQSDSPSPDSLPPTLCSSSSSHRPPQPHRHLQFRTTHRQNLRYLTSLGIIHQSDTPSPTTLSHILSTLNYFKSKGFSEPDFPRIAYLCPQFFTSTFDPTTIEPVFDFLTLDLAATPEESCKLILKRPHILQSDPDLCLKPTLDYLKSLGIKRLSSPTTLNAHLLDTRVGKLQEKLRFLRGVGFSDEESRRVCGRFPAIFGYGIEHNLRGKFEYLRREMKRDGVEEVNKFPQYFGFSLVKRIKPRFLHLKQRNVDAQVPLNRMLLWSDERFFKKWK